MDKIDDRKKKLLDALEECHGIITDACNKAGVARASYYNWINEDPEFKAACEEAQEAAIDYVEGQLFKRISGVSVVGADGEVFDQPPSDTAIIFYLKTKGKKRGYVERSEVDHSGSMQNVVTLFQIPDNGRRIEYKDNQAAGGLSGEGSK